MELAPHRPNVELRRTAEGDPIVVLAFPYDAQIVTVVRNIPQRRFDWDTKEWWAPVDDWCGVHVADVLARFPELTASPQVDQWLAGIDRRWVGRVSTMRHDGRGWWVLHTRAGTVPEALQEGSIELEDGRLLVPLTQDAGEALRDLKSARFDAGADRCLAAIELGDDPPPARLAAAERVDGPCLRLDVLWDPEVGAAFEKLPAAEGKRTVPTDPWLVEQLDAFLALHDVELTSSALTVLKGLRAESRGGGEGDPPLARDRGRADRRGGRRARRRARAVPVGRGRATCSTRAARSSPTSRASARRSRRSPRSRPTTPTRRSSSARRR